MAKSKQSPKASLHVTPITIQHLIDLATKIATAVITAPATWSVASLVYDDRLDGVFLLIVKIAAVVVVEGVLFGSIWMIESRKNLADSEKLMNAFIVWTMYAITIFVALTNGEGIIGILFRVAIAVYLIRITQSTLAYSLRRSENQEAAGQGASLKWLARIFSLILVARQMISEYSVKLKIVGTRQGSDMKAIKENGENFNMLAQDKMFLYLFENEGVNKPLLALSSPDAPNQGQRYYNLQRTPDNKYVGECPVCKEKRHGETPYSVILLINGHLKSHNPTTGGNTPLPAASPDDTLQPAPEPEFS